MKQRDIKTIKEDLINDDGTLFKTITFEPMSTSFMTKIQSLSYYMNQINEKMKEAMIIEFTKDIETEVSELFKKLCKKIDDIFGDDVASWITQDKEDLSTIIEFIQDITRISEDNKNNIVQNIKR